MNYIKQLMRDAIESQFASSRLAHGLQGLDIVDTVRDAYEHSLGAVNSSLFRTGMDDLARLRDSHSSILDEFRDRYLDHIPKSAFESIQNFDVASIGLTSTINADLAKLADSLSIASLSSLVNLNRDYSTSIKDALDRVGLGNYSELIGDFSVAAESIRNVRDLEMPLQSALARAEQIVIAGRVDARGPTERFTRFERLNVVFLLIFFILEIYQTSIAREGLALQRESQVEQSRSIEARPSEPMFGTVFIVRPDVLNVRSGPGRSHAAIGTLTKGDVVLRDKQRGEWCRVRYKVGDDGQIKGWVRCKYIGNVRLMAGEIFSAIHGERYLDHLDQDDDARAAVNELTALSQEMGLY